MPFRTFKAFSVAAPGTPQPLIGTTLSAAVTPAAGSDPKTNPIAVNLPVNDSSIAQKGDYVIVGSPTGVQERQLVTAVPDPTHITVRNLENSYAANVFVRSGQLAHHMYVQVVAGAASTDFVYIGNSPNMAKATFLNVIKEILTPQTGLQPFEWDFIQSNANNPIDVGDFWVDATATGDKFVPSFFEI